LLLFCASEGDIDDVVADGVNQRRPGSEVMPFLIFANQPLAGNGTRSNCEYHFGGSAPSNTVWRLTQRKQKCVRNVQRYDAWNCVRSVFSSALWSPAQSERLR
jgi:hypothetical protein